MIENDLKELISEIQKQKCENNFIELKSAKTDCPKLFDTLSAFSNQSSGACRTVQRTAHLFIFIQNSDQTACR